MNRNEFMSVAQDIAEVGRFLAEQGWSPATSSNYSERLSDGNLAITRSGVNKYKMTANDIIKIDQSGTVLEPLDVKSSAETLIHTTIYRLRPEAQAVLHTHSPENTRLSLKFMAEEKLCFTGYELQKAIADNRTHEDILEIPILPNSQDMKSFASTVEALLLKQKNIHGFLIAGHGLYTWGRNINEARRHVEAFEFLFRCQILELTGV